VIYGSGKDRTRYTIGPLRDLTLAQARDRANDILATPPTSKCETCGLAGHMDKPNKSTATLKEKLGWRIAASSTTSAARSLTG
jgi:hypothetical protein